MGKIKVLPPEVISKIAAGEVVERPASVVKELLENSLDAGSSEIKVEVEVGGKNLIRVTDDGEGMSPEDAFLALNRYTTSKIESAEDLFSVQTFGFRGEALSSIAAVSRMKIITRRKGELAGVVIAVEGGELKASEEIGCPLGTSVEVRSLFFNIPARLKFLKTLGTELGQIGEVLARIALAYPQVHLQLFHGGKLVTHYPVREDSRSRLAEALGKEAGKRMHFFQSRDGEVAAQGYAAEPGFDRPNSRGIYLFINQRPVRDRLLIHAVMEAYRNLIPKNRYPWAVVFVQLPPDRVDINVHPSKWEVKFADSEAVHRRVVRSIREMLETAPWLEQTTAPAKEIKDPSLFYLPMTGERISSSYHPPEALPLIGQFEEQGRVSFNSFLGQIDHTYLLFQSEDGLLLLDQHAAHERILLERLLGEFGCGAIRQQSLLFPESLELSLSEAKVIEEQGIDLKKMGFELEPSGKRTFWVKAVPEILMTREPLGFLKEIIHQLASWGKNADLQQPLDPLLRMMACRGAIQAHQPLTPEEASSLLANLQRCTGASRCPHGRPTMIQLTLSDLAKMFGRK